MAYKIGFTAKNQEDKIDLTDTVSDRTLSPRKSVVEVFFSERQCSYPYYNDSFDLRKGDIVFVDGKLEGVRGRVVDINYNFKIKLSDYKRVVGLADTNVNGRFYTAGSHFVTFERNALPYSKIISWYKAPVNEGDEYVCGSDETSFRLNNLNSLNVSDIIAERGRWYYKENKVVYICIDKNKGYAIVEGSVPYEIEFSYDNREIKGLVCSCFCSYTCKHQVAAMLQLRETLDFIEKNYFKAFKKSEYFAAMAKGTFFRAVIDSKETGEFTV